MKIRLIVTAVLFFLIAMFAAQNSEVVEVDFLFWSFSMSRALLLFLTALLGALIGWLVSTSVRFGHAVQKARHPGGTK